MPINNTDYTFREEYTKGSIDESQLDENPFIQFESWFSEIISTEDRAQNAMLLATVNKEGRPSARVVLLKQFDERGVVFYTNYNSKKAQDILENPNVALTFFSPKLEREIRIEGTAIKVDQTESDAYAQSRPYKSQVAAYVSQQSSPLSDRRVLETAYFEALKEFEGKPVPSNGGWGGFRVIPDYFEFFQGREHRLHDRIVYKLNNGQWEKSRLYP